MPKTASKPAEARRDVWNSFSLRALRTPYWHPHLNTSSLQKLWDNKCLFFKPLSLWYFILAALSKLIHHFQKWRFTKTGTKIRIPYLTKFLGDSHNWANFESTVVWTHTWIQCVLHWNRSSTCRDFKKKKNLTMSFYSVDAHPWGFSQVLQIPNVRAPLPLT